MLRQFVWITVASLVASTTSLALADDEEAGPQPTRDRSMLFDRLDANQDGVITADEVPEDRRPLFERLLRAGDADGDGKLSREEFNQVVPGERPQRDDEARPGPRRERPEGRPERPDDRPDRPQGPPPGAGFDSQAMFERLDANKDGKITQDEVPEAIRPRIEALIQRADRDGDGALTLEEFRAGIAGPFPGRPGGPDGPGGPMGGRMMAGMALFRALDTDGDGRLSSSEIADAAESLRKLDRDGDGTITVEELMAAGGLLRPGVERPEGRPPRPERPEGRLDRAQEPRERPEGRPERPRGEPGVGPRGEAGPAAMVRRLMERATDGKLKKEDLPERLQERFEQIDANSDGVIDEAELRAALGRLRPGGRPDREAAPRPRRDAEDSE